MNTLVVVYYVAAAVAVVLLVTRVVRSRGGSGGPVHDRYEAAFLNGGPARVADTALAALQYDGRIAIGGPGIVAVVRPVAHDPVERAVLEEHAAAPHGALHHLRLAVMRHPAVQEIGDGLAGRGLIVEPSRRRTTVGWCTGIGLTAFFLFPVSVALTMVELSTAPEMSVPFVVKVLPALFGAGVAAIACGAVAGRRITPAGQRAVSAYGRAHGHLADAGHLVALYGLRGLPDPVLQEQLLAAARVYAPRGRGRRPAAGRRHLTDDAFAGVPAEWCAENSFCGSGSSGGNSGSCSSGSCSSGSCSGGGSGSSCSSSGGSSCSSSSSSGSSCSSSSSSG
ncbi:TIGR04222 domain-containing membrane protein [Streptomyces sp. NPDC015130]|uniref:TIGR04222 domain-containing membrane protein n=1 Tax=Streptomyces sp. NPDC015130 TaxID=3364940 RepID=UPI0036FE9F0E